MRFLDRDERRILKEERKAYTKIPIKYKFFNDRNASVESSFYTMSRASIDQKSQFGLQKYNTDVSERKRSI